MSEEQHHWQTVFQTSMLHRAEICKAILEENEILSVIVDKKDSVYQIGEYKVMVNSKDYENGLIIIQQLKF